MSAELLTPDDEAALQWALEMATRVFTARGNHAEIHLSRDQYAAHIGAAYHEGRKSIAGKKS